MSDLKKASVEQWGYTCGSGQEAAALVWPVRFKPGMTLALVLAGLVLNNSWILIVTGGAGILGTLVQPLSWIDLFYNHVLRRLFHSPPLVADPPMRRAMCGLADVFVLGAGLLLRENQALWAGLFAYAVILLSGTVLLTGICPPAYLVYRLRASKRA